MRKLSKLIKLSKLHQYRIKLSDRIGVLSLSLLLYLFSIFSVHTAEAAEVENSQEISSSVQTTSLQNTVSSITRDERLSDAEWIKYRQWMQGPDGRWYPHLSPAAVLGLHAETESERQHFANLVAQEEHDKIAREMIFNHAVYLAVKRLFPAEPVIQSFDKTPFNPQKNRGNHP